MTKNRLLYISLALGAFILILLFVLITRWESRVGFGFLEVVLTFAIGVLGNVLATGWFLWMFQKDDVAKLDHLMKMSEQIKLTCDFLYQRGIRVARKRDQLHNSFYEQHYEAATKVHILGIANKSFMRNFYPGYAEKEFDLSYAKEQPLFQRLQNTPGFLVTVLFLDPDSRYARSRNGEHDNKRTIQDLREIRAALDKIRNAYKSDGASKEWRLSGRLEFMVFRENPHYSIFLAQRGDDDERSVIVVGLLPKNMSGDDCPSVIIHQHPDHRDLFRSYVHQLEEIKKSSETLLCWDDRGIT